MGILIVPCVILMAVGFFGYNGLRRKWAGIIGVGGAYLITTGIMIVVMLVGSIVQATLGDSEGITGSAGPLEIITMLVIMALCLLYMVRVMLTRCHSTAQRIGLPFVAIFISAGFIWRLMASIVLHMPMETGAPQTQEAVFPDKIFRDSDNAEYRLLNAGGDNATYYNVKTNENVVFYVSDFEGGAPSGFYMR